MLFGHRYKSVRECRVVVMSTGQLLCLFVKSRVNITGFEVNDFFFNVSECLNSKQFTISNGCVIPFKGKMYRNVIIQYSA